MDSTKLKFHIENFSADTMEMYGCRHAIEEHLFQGRTHMIRKLKKNIKVMKSENLIHACMFMSREKMAESIKACLVKYQDTIENYLYSSIVSDLVIDFQFEQPIAYGIALGSDWNKFHPASGLHLVIQKNSYTSFCVVTAYAYPGFEDIDEWYDAIDTF